MEFSLEFLFDVTVVSGVVGGDGDLGFLGKTSKMFDEVDGEGTLGDVSTGLSG